MPEQLKDAMQGDEDPLTRKTTDICALGDTDPLERAQVREPALILLEGDYPGQVFRIRTGRQIIGRRPECDIRLRERAVSGVHAEITRVRDNVTINDLSSTNGTLLNGARIRRPMPLMQGNLVRIGNCVFKYVDSLLEVEFTEELHARGTIDQLTGAFNRSYLVLRLGSALDFASRERPVSVITFDFDNFKQVNDQFGHAAGDYVLESIADMVMQRFVRRTDLFARMGGEEFVIVLADTPAAQAQKIAEELRVAIEETTFIYESMAIRLTSSFGVCCAISPSEQPEIVLARADEKLYHSKREGRNRVSS